MATMMEKTDYEVLREWTENGYNCAQLRNLYNGATIITRTPIRSRQEEEKALSGFVEAAFRIMYPDKDLAGTRLTLTADEPIKYAKDYVDERRKSRCRK